MNWPQKANNRHDKVICNLYSSSIDSIITNLLFRYKKRVNSFTCRLLHVDLSPDAADI